MPTTPNLRPRRRLHQAVIAQCCLWVAACRRRAYGLASSPCTPGTRPHGNLPPARQIYGQLLRLTLTFLDLCLRQDRLRPPPSIAARHSKLQPTTPTDTTDLAAVTAPRCAPHRAQASTGTSRPCPCRDTLRKQPSSSSRQRVGQLCVCGPQQLPPHVHVRARHA